MLGCMSAARFKRAVSRMDALPYPLDPWLQACADAGAGSAGAAALSSGESLESLDEQPQQLTISICERAFPFLSFLRRRKMRWARQ